jgi:hypothetical protein
MSLLEALQYEREFSDMEIRNEEVVNWYKENPEEMKTIIDRLKQFKSKVFMSKIKDCYKNAMAKCADKSLELLGYNLSNPATRNPYYKENTSQVKENGDDIFSYIIPLGIMLIPMILDEILPKKVERKNEVETVTGSGISSYLNIFGDNKSD